MSAGSRSFALLHHGRRGSRDRHNGLCLPRGLLPVLRTQRGNVAMTSKRALLAIMIVVLAVVVFFAWMAWNEGHLGWAHVVGMGVSILLLVLIWIWSGTQQPTQPPS